MYPNLASIVDLRNNIHFNQTRLTPPVRVAHPENLNRYHDINSRPEPVLTSGGANDSRILRNRGSTSRLYGNGDLTSCGECAELRARVHELESRLFATSEKLASFEYEVLSILKGISEDVKDMKRQGNSSILRSPSPKSAFSLRHEGENSSFNFENSSGGAREAIAGACMALEQLIFDAKNVSTQNPR